MAPSRMQFDVSLGRPGAGARDDEAPMRILVLADLGGSRRVPLAQRRPLAVDIDGFDEALARIAPKLQIEIDGLPVEIAPRALDDFHPDHLFAKLPPFDALRHLRAELADPSQFARVAAALGLPMPGAAATTPAETATPVAADDVQRLLGRPLSPPAPAASVAPGAAGLLQNWLRDWVAPHVVPDRSHEQRALREAADAAASALMRRVLHHPRWQALEAAWRGIDRLVRELELGEALQLQVLDVGRDEIAADIADHAADLTASALHRCFSGPGGPDSRRWSLFVLDQAFGAEAADAQLLAALGALAARAGAPLLAGATPQAAGAADLAQLAEPRRWLSDDAPGRSHWAALRGSPMAAWIGLALPRVLLRLPYGAATDPVASFEFEEMPEPPNPAAYLWGGSALALALLAGRAFQQDGWAPSLDSQLRLDDLPSHIVSVDGEKRQQPTAELFLGEEVARSLAERGLMALMSWRDRPAASLLRWTSLADPPCALRGLGD